MGLGPNCATQHSLELTFPPPRHGSQLPCTRPEQAQHGSYPPDPPSPTALRGSSRSLERPCSDQEQAARPGWGPAGDRVLQRLGPRQTGGCGGGAGAVWKANYCLQGGPQSSWREPDQRAARCQRVTAPTASRSRWQPWGDWPGTECDILGVTGRHVGLGREQAGPRAHPPRLTARSSSLKRQPSAQPLLLKTLQKLPIVHRIKAKTPLLCIPSPSQAGPRLPHRLISCQSQPKPSAPAKWTCCSANKLFSQPPTPTPLFTPFHLPGNVLPRQSPPPCVSV